MHKGKCNNPPQQMMQQVPVQGQQYQWVQVPVNSAPVYANQAVQPHTNQCIKFSRYQPLPQFSQPMQQITTAK